MATSRTAKVQAEIEKAREKMAAQQTRLKELEQKRVELENTEIVDIVRGMSIPLDELAPLLQSLKGSGSTSANGAPARPAAWGEDEQRSGADAQASEGKAEQSLRGRVPKSAPVITDNNTIDQGEDTE